MLTCYRHANGHTELMPEFRPELLAEARVLTEAFHFHPLAVEDCLTDVNLPREWL